MDFKALSDPVIVVNDNHSDKPSFFKKIRPPLTNFFKNKKLLGGALTVLLLFAVGLGVFLSQKPTQLAPQAAAEDAEISIRPTTINTNPNQEFNAEVFLDTKNYNMTAAEVKITYDPTKLQLLETKISSSDLLPSEIIPPTNASGSVHFIYGNLSGVKGNGKVASLKFKALAVTDSTPTKIEFDASTKGADLDSGSKNVLTNLVSSSVNISSAVPETSLSFEAPSQASTGQEFQVKVLSRSDIDNANLWDVKIKFQPNLMEAVSINKTGSFINSWTSQNSEIDNTKGEIRLVGGVPSPGYKTNLTNELFATITFRAKSPGDAALSFDQTSSIFKNSDNSNILQNRNTANILVSGDSVSVPSSTPSPTPSPTPVPSVVSGKGDGDNNGKVELRDLSILYSKWSTINNITSHFQLDFNDDLKINTLDVSAMRNLLISLGVIRG